jgi:pimeloyl-ACP methyl ester carboxylesterase
MTIAKSITWLLAASACLVEAQAPKQLLEQLAPSPATKLVTIDYTNPFDQSRSEAMVELPKNLSGPAPLIVSPHAANWTQEMNRCLWTGVADQFGVIILYPRHQGMLNPRVSFGSPKQLANLQAAIAEVERRYPVNKARVYAAGLSQGAIETLLLAGHYPKQFAGALAINPVADFIAFYEDIGPAGVEQTSDESLRKLREAQWPALRKICEAEFGGVPDIARASYYSRSAVLFARDLAAVPLILYWAEDDELIPNGAAHQGGMLAKVIRDFQPPAFHEVKHVDGHGYPFYKIDLAKMTVTIFPREIFLASVKEMLKGPRVPQNHAR